MLNEQPLRDFTAFLSWMPYTILIGSLIRMGSNEPD